MNAVNEEKKRVYCTLYVSTVLNINEIMNISKVRNMNVRQIKTVEWGSTAGVNKINTVSNKYSTTL